MTQRQRQASGSLAALAAAPTALAEGAAACAPRFGPDANRGAPRAVLWEEFYRSASPSQQRELLSLAGRQGFLYAHQLPPAGNGSRPPAPDPMEGPLPLLGQLLEDQAQNLRPACSLALPVRDVGLDAAQQEAVARALGTPDLCLIQGLPGTGKSRVAAEIIAQAASRGERVLLLAPSPPAVDRILEALTDNEMVCPVRCLAADEKAENLPPPLRAMTFAEKVRSLRERSVQDARQGRERAEQRCQQRQREANLWPRLLELAERIARLDGERTVLRDRRAQVPEEVRREAGEVDAGEQLTTANAFVAGLRSCGKRHGEFLAASDAALEAARQEHTKGQQALDCLEAKAEPLRSLVAARQQGRWWSPARWRAVIKRDVVGKLAALDGEIASARATLTEREDEIQRLSAQRMAAERVAQAEWMQLVDVQIQARQDELSAQEEALAHELLLLQNKWENLCLELQLPGERPASPCQRAVQDAHELWQAQAVQDEERCAFAHQWSAYLEEAAEEIAARLPDYTNLVAATTGALLCDPHFGDAAPARLRFDLLVLEEATYITESEFLQVARRAARWVLIGQTTIEGDTLGALPKSASGKAGRPGISAGSSVSGLRSGFFQCLWQQLHADPSRLGYAWVQEGGRICCRLRAVAADQRRWVESERVADFPEIELRILALPRLKPALAEVLFPASMSIHEAKQYLYRELEEFPVQAPGRSLVWVEQEDRLILRLATTPAADALPVALENGIREWVGRAPADPSRDQAAAVWHTCRLEFERAAGWDRAAAQAWVRDHLQIIDLGRTAWLEVPHRMTPGLAAVLWDVLYDESLSAESNATHAAPSYPALEFVAVPPLTHGKGHRDRVKAGRPERRSSSAVLGDNLPCSGAGLELDLAAPRQGDRLPSELRAGLPGRGFVNYLEAQAVVRRLEALVAEGVVQTPGEIAVIALYPAQVELIRRLLHQSPRLKQAPVSVMVDLPSAFRQKECAVVLLSLTRSHAHRAVSFGESPQALTLAMTRACTRLIVFGDPGTCLRRSLVQGAVDHLDEAATAREAQILTRLVRYLQGQGRHPRAFLLSEGSSA